ncbi:MAG: carboxypeptidase regulatory-like domain-containing protein, partial [Candidatus Zixiibacteriota bacterium]
EDLVSVQEIMLLKSTDEGVTWIHSDTDYNISFDGAPANDAYDPDIAIDNNDNIFVVWHQRAASDTSEIHISISTDAGNTWSGRTGDRYISYRSGQIASNPHIAIAPNNDIYVVWDEPAIQGNSATNRILYGKSTDGGATFNSETADQPISTQIKFSGDPIVVIDDMSKVHVTWQASLDSVATYRYEVFYSGSADGGATWSGLAGPQYVDFGPDDGSSASNHGMGITSGGCLVVVWQETPINFDDSEIWASYSTDGGLTWSSNDEPELISFPDGRGGWRPDVVAGVGDTLHAVWNESAEPSGGNYYDIHYSKGDTLATGANFPGSISGTVSDGTNPVESVFVEVTGTLKNDLTDSNGNYTTAKLAAGAYDVFFSHIDYNDTTITGVVVNPNGSVTILDVVLSGGPGGCDYAVGDVNGSGNYNGLDITYGVAYFKGGADPLCPDCPVGDCNSWHYCGDVNASCNYNGLDITYGVAYFKGGPGPMFCVDCPPAE